jgi:hypothetical protein
MALSKATNEAQGSPLVTAAQEKAECNRKKQGTKTTTTNWLAW